MNQAEALYSSSEIINIDYRKCIQLRLKKKIKFALILSLENNF